MSGVEDFMFYPENPSILFITPKWKNCLLSGWRTKRTRYSTGWRRRWSASTLGTSWAKIKPSTRTLHRITLDLLKTTALPYFLFCLKSFNVNDLSFQTDRLYSNFYCTYSRRFAKFFSIAVWYWWSIKHLQSWKCWISQYIRQIWISAI